MSNEMTTDNMSNEEVIEVLKGIVFNGFDRTTAKERQALHLAIKALEEKTQGEWIDYSEEGFVECPFCHKATTCEDNIDELHYCWNCGAKMKGGAE